ncbi:sulfite exporter TauE/SafE family protein [Nocardia bovistercoris]|uniref:Probable membrane transporter protein n=1 Tax=Nocardia bovistercoris TaxID=2785916 RepID=A0A931IGE6_9NOCA|nr:sulfite exporter TauE/SafE family protein [Nocardia bovistercoris]MBH0780881.1 sulfite exporter TauE/SafE family protein [Nocardia bovistercoris]
MTDIALWQYVTFAGSAFAAGIVDAIVGGGGLLQLPVLLGSLDVGGGVATPLGVNKAVTAIGNTASIAQFWRRNPDSRVDPRILIGPGLIAVVSASVGALFVSNVPIQTLRPIIIVCLLAALVNTLRGTGKGKEQDRSEQSSRGRHAEIRLAAVSTVLGLYDGFVGPGTGTFLLLSHRRLLRRTLTDSLATTKIIQCGMNIGGAAVLLSQGVFVWHLILLMGACSMGGASIGARIALNGKDQLIKRVLVAAVLATVVKLIYDQISSW